MGSQKSHGKQKFTVTVTRPLTIQAQQGLLISPLRLLLGDILYTELQSLPWKSWLVQGQSSQ